MSEDLKNYSAHISLELEYPLEKVSDPQEIVRGIAELPLEEIVKKCGGKMTVQCENWTVTVDI